MTIELIIQGFVVAFLGGLIFSIIGIIPGTDETATMVPITLVLVLLGLNPLVLFSWTIGVIVAMQITHTIPTSMAALPGSTIAVPMVYYSSIAKRLGIPHIGMRKMAAGSLIGSFIALPISIIFAYFLAPLGDVVKPYIGLIFTIGAIIIAYMSSAKWAAIISLIPYSFLIQGLQRIAVETVDKTLFISIFMGITIGPMISELFNVFVPKVRSKQRKDKPNEIWLAPDIKENYGYYPNPLRFFTRKQRRSVILASLVSSCMFTFSPVGTTVLFGELISGRKKELYDKITTTLGVQDAVSNATYIGGLIIPLLAFGLPLSPVALGPAAPLFNAPPVFTIEPIHNLHNYLSFRDYIVFGLIGIIGGSLLAYPISIRKARVWTEIMLKKISHEALIGSFLGLIFMLAFYEAGIMGIIIALSIGLFGGILHNLFDIHTGVQFMAYYASSWIVSQLISLSVLIK
ncbi:tripartite tricarboxylate transporter permease [Tepidimicrobium xylanilyticum]|uniref:Tripartite tricarboxylate transporter TctA family protein n=1 Tax=Tepidimicrobium xylanilyticum TaxID=1123352 RepID=A0A1H2Q9L3_9FIRM|nr:tripartite tricarboxylate transporter permease [Tepidimicrobium xylanilyticum]SDW03883.1 Tripartite tricarboxylate transporter TctA family protein [Tepidimicrobium xylanilyticum]